jgi:N utilization substance protein B
MRVESRARARALQAVYAWDLRGGETGRLLPVAEVIWDDLLVGADERALAAALVRTLDAKRADIDAELTEVTANWRLERLAVIDRCVLRLAAAELLRGETPPRVVIQESIHLAERYGGVQSARFVNGVVDALARRMGRV